MDGKEYTQSFVTGELADRSTVIADLSDVQRHKFSSVLADKVHLLYGIGEIQFLTDEPTPLAVEAANETLSDMAIDGLSYSAANKIAVVRNRQAGRHSLPEQFIFKSLSLTSSTADKTSEEVAKDIQTESGILSTHLVDYSDRMFSSALVRLNQRGRQKELTAGVVAKEVKQILGNERSRFRQVLEPYEGVISVQRDRPLLSFNKTGGVVAMRVIAECGGKYVPDWLPAIREWNKPLQLLCGYLAEVEAFVALQEWVLERNLPYMPIMAPLQYEQGKLQPSFRGGNMRADILLCCLLPDRNEIIPIQVKNDVTQKQRSEYNSNVVLVGAKELGMESIESCVLQMASDKKTGIRGTMRYGRILSHYLAARPAGGRARQPSKADRQLLADTLNPAFTFFDYKIVEQMRLYQNQQTSTTSRHNN